MVENDKPVRNIWDGLAGSQGVRESRPRVFKNVDSLCVKTWTYLREM